MTNERQNLQIIQDCYAAFGRGDIAFVLDMFADELTDFGVISETPTGVPWHFRARDKAGVVRYFEMLGGALETRGFAATDLAAAGDHVYATVRQSVVVRANGKPLDLTLIHRFTLRDGKIVAWRGSEDTAATRDAAGR
jgi:ketosteroid isomerase-like protein